MVFNLSRKMSVGLLNLIFEVACSITAPTRCPKLPCPEFPHWYRRERDLEKEIVVK
jgi:hypothetical protein